MSRIHRLQAGFTLLEIMVAFTIAALLMGVTTPAMMKMYDSMKYRDSVRSIISGIHATRYAALERGVVMDFIVTPEFRQFRIGNGEENQLPESMTLIAHTAREVSRGGGTAVIRFYPDGSASGGSIDVVHEAGNGVRLRVDWLLGKLTQEAYEPS